MKKLLLSTLLLCSFGLSAETDECRRDKAVLEKIIREAELMYPNNYSMQKWQVESELKAYKEMKNLKEALINLTFEKNS